MNSRLADVKSLILHETQDAYLLKSYFTGKADWVPKSLVEHDKDSGEATMPEWLALEKGLI